MIAAVSANLGRFVEASAGLEKIEGIDGQGDWQTAIGGMSWR
jgi:hypothetical protein